MKFDPIEEKKIIQSCKNDISNFSVLYEKYVRQLYSYCLSRCNGNKDIVFDIVSETFIKAMENISKYKYQNKPFITWLYVIAHNLIIDSYRNKPQISIEELEYEVKEETESILDTLADDEMKKRIKEIVLEMPQELKQIIMLRNDQDLSFAQISDIVGKSEAAVKMRYYRSLLIIKRKMFEFDPLFIKKLKLILFFIQF